MVEAARASCVHHHPVQLLLRIGSSEDHWLVLKIFWVLRIFVHSRCLAALLSLVDPLLSFPRVYSCLFNLLVLEYVGESYASHVGVVGCLVVVRQHGLSLVVCALVFSVEAPAQVTLELVVVDALVVHLTQRRVVESFRVVGQNLRVVSVRETTAPLLGELQICLWKRANELVVNVDPVVHAVVSNNGLLGLNHCLDNQGKAHFVDVKLLLGALGRQQLLHRLF